MKKIFRFMTVAAAVVAAASCSEEFAPKPASEKGLVKVTINATLEDATTKTTLGSDLSVGWELNDTVAVWDGKEARKFVVSYVNSSKEAVLTGEVAADASTLYAVYPNTAFASVTDSVLNVTVPATQYVSKDHPADPAALVSYAKGTKVSDGFTFKNLTSLAKVTVSGTDTKYLKILGNNTETTEYCAGATAFDITADVPAVKACTGNSSITLSPEGTATALAAGDYYVAMAPSTFAKGITAVAAKEDGLVVLASADSVVFVRNGGAVLGDVAANSKAVKVSKTISSAADLLTFNQYCNYFTATDVIKLGADIDLTGIDYVPAYNRYYGSIDGQNHRIYNYKARNDVRDASIFGRIGSGSADTPFYIKNIAFGTKDYDFSTGKGTYDGVSTVTFNDKDDGSSYWYPGQVAYVYAYGTVENLVNYTPVVVTAECTSRHRAGALLGTVKANVTIKNCVNYGNISDDSDCSVSTKGATVGGLVGAFDGANCLMDGCSNYGTVTIGANYVTDAAGLIGYDNYVSTVQNSTNYGNVIINKFVTKGCRFGGCVSQTSISGSTGAENPSVYTKVCNRGDVILNGNAAVDCFVGGIAARTYGTTMTDCDNYGKVTANVTNTGKNIYISGISANTLSSSATTAVSTLKDCDNNGAVTCTSNGARFYISGVTSYNATSINSYVNCTNTADLTAVNCTIANNGYIAGIVALDNSGAALISDCSNSGTLSFVGDVQKNSYVGGILAQSARADCKVDNCKNTGKICGGSADQATVSTIMTIGGVVGTTVGTVTNCVNEGELEFKPNTAKPCRLFLGGVIAANTVPTEVSGCTNKGKINIGEVSFSAYSFAGGVSGTMNPVTFKNNRNEGDITSEATTTKDVAAQFYLGGLVGVALAANAPSATFSGNSVKCTLTANANTAAYAGMALGRNAYVTAWSMGTADDPVKVAGSFNGTAVSADNVKTLAFGSGNTDAAGAVCTVNAALGE